MGKKGVVSEILKQKLKEDKPQEKAGSQSIKRTSICLPESLYKGLKAYAAVEGIKLNALMVEILKDGLKKRLEKKKLNKELFEI